MAYIHTLFIAQWKEDQPWVQSLVPEKEEKREGEEEENCCII